jgi:hypothetical protein
MRLTSTTKEAMSRAIQIAADYLEHPSMVILPRPHSHPQNVARALYLAKQLITAKGRLLKKKEIMNDLQVAADYLSNPQVVALPFTLKTSNLARALREIIRDLK